MANKWKDVEYTYHVEEYSQDTRNYHVVSNVKLSKDEVISIYTEADASKESRSRFTTGLEKHVDWELHRTMAEIPKIKVKSMFVGTEYGDDCQLEVSGEFTDE